MVKYVIRREDKPDQYLQNVEPNVKYCPSASAPTMGRKHDVSEYSTVWGTEKKSFERLTAAGYIATLMEEFRWGDVKTFSVTLEPTNE